MHHPETVRRCLLPIALAVGILIFVYSVHSQDPLQVGFGVFTVDGDDEIAVGTALFSQTNTEGVLIWEAGVAAVEPLSHGRIFVDQEQDTKTAIALANPGNDPVTVTLTLRDSAGLEVDSSTKNFAPKQHQALFVDELFPEISDFTGSLTFQTQENTEKLAAVTLRQNTNLLGEEIFATLPVVDLTETPNTASIVFPHIGAGEGLSTQLVLMNSSASTVGGQIQLVGSTGVPLELELDEVMGSTFPYQIEAHGTFRGQLSSTGPVTTGYAVVTPDEGHQTPSGSAIFQFTASGSVLSEAGVGATLPTTKARLFVDNAGTRTGVAIASPGNPQTTVTFDLLSRSGGLSIEKTTRSLPAQGHLAVFADELFELPPGFTGLMEITSPAPIVPITLKLTENQRGHPILTTLPIADLTRLSSAESLVFPQVGLGEIPGVGEISTRLLLINTNSNDPTSGILSFFKSDGTDLIVPLGEETGSQFPYQVSRGGARQFYPGLTADLAAIIVGLSALVVNEEETIPLNLIILDEEGNPRDDFTLMYSSLNPAVVTVDSVGNITGVSLGFGDLIISSGEVVVSITITVTKITGGATGFEISGIAQDFAGQIYLANTQDHTILLAEEISQAPTVWAGINQTSGLVNDVRLSSRFNGPAFLSLNQADGTLFVTDGANHVIRRVLPGDQGTVETLAGTEQQAGSQDGMLTQASFNNPQGVALDRQGNLWVVDTGNHTIRRINLDEGMVETVAGQAGVAGSNDGVGSQARFDSPVGIAFETEPLALQLERERQGDPPPPVTMVVADTGNGLIRRVHEDGTVETIVTGTSSPSAIRNLQGLSGLFQIQIAPAAFKNPTGVVVDSFGNIYVSEPDLGRVRTILRSGEVVIAARTGTFDRPQGLAVTSDGRVLVAEKSRSVREIQFAGPTISTIVPSRTNNLGGARITIRGRNFTSSTVVVVGRTLVDALVEGRRTISFTAPPLPSGRLLVTVLHRGGYDQFPLFVQPVAVSELAELEIVTVAGGTPFARDGSIATTAQLGLATHLAFDPEGNLLITDSALNRIRKVNAVTRIITTVVGNREPRLVNPQGIAFDRRGNLYVVDTGHHVIRVVTSDDGTFETLAGNGDQGFSGDGGPAAEASFSSPIGISAAPNGTIFIADSKNHRIRRVSAATGIITTVTGTGTAGFSGDNGPATQASLSSPQGVLYHDGDLWIADTNNHVVRKVDGDTGVITTVAGSGIPGFSGDQGPATSARLLFPTRVAIDSSGNLAIADTGNFRIRRVDARTGIISTLAGNGENGFSGEDGIPTSAALSLPLGLAFNAAADLFIADAGNHRVRRVIAARNVSGATNVIVTVAGDGEPPTEGDGGPATEASLSHPAGTVVDSAGNLLIADSGHHRVRRVDAQSQIITSIVGTDERGFSQDGVSAAGTLLNVPSALALDTHGALLIADRENHRVRRVDLQTGLITTIAGNGVAGFSGDGGPATEASLFSPQGLAVDTQGNVFISDTGNHRIRFVNTNGMITTLISVEDASGAVGPPITGVGGFFTPRALALGSEGNLFIADSGGHRIWRIDPEGVIIAVAGNGQSGTSGDNGPATEAFLAAPHGLAVDQQGNLFIGDTGSHRVRRVDASSGIITTFAGTGKRGFQGDNGAAAEAVFNFITDLSLDNDGNLYITDFFNQRIRIVRAATAVVLQ